MTGFRRILLIVPSRVIIHFLPVTPQLLLPSRRWWQTNMKRFPSSPQYLTALLRWWGFHGSTIKSIGPQMYFLARHWDISPRKPSSGFIATKKADTAPFILGLAIEAVVWSCHPDFKNNPLRRRFSGNHKRLLAHDFQDAKKGLIGKRSF